ncbi:MAG: CotH kinase family protein [Eubacteriales bacterium]
MSKTKDKSERKKIIIKWYLSICLFFLCVLFFCTIGIEKSLGNLASELPLLSAKISANNDNSKESDYLVSCWWSEPYESYYLFMPSSVKNQKVQVIVGGNYNLLWDGDEISQGEYLEFAVGAHEVEVIETGEKYVFQVLQSENLGAVFIETESRSMDYVKEIKGNQEAGSMIVLDQSGCLLHKGSMEYIEGRGNTSWNDSDKKPYEVKLEENANLFGMGNEKNWLLLANANDTTGIKNGLVFDMADEVGLAYTPESEWIDLYINGEYQGNYQLTEKIEIGAERIDVYDLEAETRLLNPSIDSGEFSLFTTLYNVGLQSIKGVTLDNNPKDITGGYLLEIDLDDRYELASSGFITSRGENVVVSSPSEASREEVQYISTLYQGFEDAIYSEDGINPDTNLSYMEYIDMDSFATKYILEEITKNLDATYTSQYFYKPADYVSTKLFAGPVWDYDKALGIDWENTGVQLSEPDTFFANVATKESAIWYGLYQQPEFLELVKEIYQEEYQPYLDNVAETMQNMTDYIEKSLVMNMVRWNMYYELTDEEKEEALETRVQKIIDFIEQRRVFLDSEWND